MLSDGSAPERPGDAFVETDVDAECDWPALLAAASARVSIPAGPDDEDIEDDVDEVAGMTFQKKNF